MLVKCCVPDCDSPPNVSYYSWPKEKKNSAEWCTLVFKSMDIPANMNKKLLVCAQHFSRDDYVMITVDKDPNPNERLVEYILADCQVPKCVADFFVKCRIRHRIKILNTKHLQPRRDIRALKQLGQFQN